jgi:hypothetical protein
MDTARHSRNQIVLLVVLVLVLGFVARFEDDDENEDEKEQFAQENKPFRHSSTDSPGTLTPQPPILDCGGKRSATPLLDTAYRAKSGVVAVQIFRSAGR